MILIIAYGNDLRQDDGAGHQLAEQLAQRCQNRSIALRHLATQQLAPELAVDIAAAGVSAVVFVDTRAVAQERLSIDHDALEVTVTPLQPDGAGTPSLGHHLQPGVLLAYARALLEDRPAPPAWLVTVPGAAFGHGRSFSQTASTALRTAFEGEGKPLQHLLEGLAKA